MELGHLSLELGEPLEVEADQLSPPLHHVRPTEIEITEILTLSYN